MNTQGMSPPAHPGFAASPKPPVTSEELVRWFTGAGWVVVRQRPTLVAAESERGLPEGMALRLIVVRRVLTGVGAPWDIHARLVARNSQVLLTDRSCTLAGLDELPVVVSSFGPKSFQHVVVAFARELGIGGAG